MVEYVVDLKGFYDDANNLIIKDFCVQTIENDKLVGVGCQSFFYHHLILNTYPNRRKTRKLVKEKFCGFS